MCSNVFNTLCGVCVCVCARVVAGPGASSGRVSTPAGAVEKDDPSSSDKGDDSDSLLPIVIAVVCTLVAVCVCLGGVWLLYFRKERHPPPTDGAATTVNAAYAPRSSDARDPAEITIEVLCDYNTAPLFQNGSAHLDLRCILQPTPYTQT